MSPRYLRYRFPSAPSVGYPGAERRARALAALFLAIPPHELSAGHLDTEAAMLTDRGRLDYVDGDPMGTALAPWLRLLVGPAGRRAWIDVDVEEMGRLQAEAMRERSLAARGRA